jgi:alpha-glucosidase
MKRKPTVLFLLSGLILNMSCSLNKIADVISPDGSNKFVFSIEPGEMSQNIASFYLEVGEKKILLPSSLEIDLKENPLKKSLKIIGTESISYDKTWVNSFGERREIPDRYNEIKILLENDEIKINLICRAYNEGIAFAYEIPEQNGMDSVTITGEKITFNFPSDHYAWSAARAQAQYSRVPLSQIANGCERPLVIEIDTNIIIALAEAKLVDYSRMKFNPDSTRN